MCQRSLHLNHSRKIQHLLSLLPLLLLPLDNFQSILISMMELSPKELFAVHLVQLACDIMNRVFNLWDNYCGS